MKRNRAINEHERTCPDCQRVIAETNAESRLSHDRGADAGWEALKFLSDRYGHTVESDGEDNWARFGAIEAALSVPAPTLPALDGEDET